MQVGLSAVGDEDLYIEGVLEVGGNAYKTGGGLWFAISDERLKKDITPYQDGLEKLLQIEPVRFSYNDRFPITNSEKQFIGIIAQDMQEIAPYMVEERAFGRKAEELPNGEERVIDKGENFLTYDGSALTYMLVNAVQELNLSNEQLKAENEALRVELQTIKKHLGLETKD
jgi:hypothetical protein